MVTAWQAVANAVPPERPPGWDPRLLWATLALVAIILVGALVIYLIDRWRKRSEPVGPTANEQLAHFRELYEREELSQEEFERIRAHLSKLLKQEFQIPTSPPSPNPLQPAESPKPADEGKPPVGTNPP